MSFEFYGGDHDAAAEATTDYEANRRRARQKMTDWEEQTFRWVIKDVQYMELESFVRLDVELTEHQRRRVVYMDGIKNCGEMNGC